MYGSNKKDSKALVSQRGHAFKRALIIFGIYLALLIVSAFFFYPIFFAIVTSLQKRAEIFTLPPKLIFTPSITNYIKVVTMWKFDAYFMNSVIISTASVIGALLLGIPCAYILSRYDIPRKMDIAFIILSFRFLPPVAIAIPLYILYTKIGLFDTHLGLILIYIIMNLPFVVWIMKGFFDEVPIELEEAAQIDGYSRLHVFFRFTLPLVARGISATALFCLLLTWNEFGLALVLTGINARTLPVQALQFVASLGLDWGALTAAAIIIALPMIIFGIIIRNYLVRGLTLGVVK